MSKTRQLAIMAALLCGTAAAHAESNGCGIDPEAIVKQAYPEARPTDKGTYTLGGATITLPTADSINGDPHALICKNWPAHPELTLVAVPLMTSIAEGENDGDLELLVFDSANHSVQQRLKFQGRMSDDAVQIRSVVLDTARYQLAPDRMAFGVRITREGSSHANPFEEVDLWLYVIDHGQLKPVLDGIVTGDSGGEWDTSCAGTFNDARRTLSVDPAIHNGYADIVVTEKASSSTAAVGKDGQCNEKNAPSKKQSYRLSYDGKTYVVPKALRPL
jgi:hypothetical protein